MRGNFGSGDDGQPEARCIERIGALPFAEGLAQKDNVRPLLQKRAIRTILIKDNQWP